MKLIKYLFIVFFSSLIISSIASRVMLKGLRKSSIDFFGKINAARDKSNKIDIFLIGSSRMLVQADPKIIDSVTGLRSYNYGLNAVSVKTCYNILQYAVINHSNAKFAVFNIEYNMFDYLKDPYKDAFYYPFEEEIPSLIMTDTGVYKNIHKLKIFDIAMYDDRAKYAAVSGYIAPGKPSVGVYKGYNPSLIINYFEVPVATELSVRNTIFLEKGFNMLYQMIKLCKRNNIVPVFVIAPYRKKYAPEIFIKNYQEIILKVKILAKNEAINFFDYTENPMKDRDIFFYNSSHLNQKGANIYSVLLGQDLKKLIP